MLKIKTILAASLTLMTNMALADGFPYVGVSVGEVTNTSDSFYRSYRGIPLTFNAGYGALLSQNLYLGTEVFGVASTAGLNNEGLETTYGYGLSLLPGILLSDHTMTYARVGVVRSRFTPSNSPHHNITGGQLGLGMQIDLTQNVGLRGEYIFTGYQSFSGISSPKQDQFTIGLIYKFN